jgi:hypothetical protein
MPSRIRIILYAILALWWVIWLLFLFFGIFVPGPAAAGSTMDWLTTVDQWIINHIRFPGTFSILLGLTIGMVVIPEAWRVTRQVLDAIESRGMSGLSLAQASAHDLYLYLLLESIWGQRRYAELNFREHVADRVSAEIDRAATSGEVRVLGRRPNSATMEQIDRAYWQFAKVEGDRLRDRRNTQQTVLIRTGEPAAGLQAYFDLGVPRIDVRRTWPRASIFRKVATRLYVWGKRRWYALWPGRPGEWK